jgi:hypothetical protein
VFKLGILLGLAAGAVAALLMAKPEPFDEEVVEGDDLQARLKRIKQQVSRQLQEARQAAREESEATEAEMQRDFEDTLRQSRQE